MKHFTQLIILFTLTLMAMVGCISIQTRTFAKKCVDKKKITTEIEIAECPRDYEPVCGCDGKTYGNICVAEKSGVISWTDGGCVELKKRNCVDESKIEPKKDCEDIIEFVCACDGKTYDNKCLAEKAGVLSWREGECAPCVLEGRNGSIACPTHWDPVCGCDGKTYGNDCEAAGYGVTRWKTGSCEKRLKQKQQRNASGLRLR